MRPQQIDDVEFAFPGNVDRLMPSYLQIPSEFKEYGNPYNQLAEKWFFFGGSTESWIPKEDINKAIAIRHLTTIMRSYHLKHEHKIASVAYLLSQWFDIPEVDHA